jgi:hypothetical protein
MAHDPALNNPSWKRALQRSLDHYMGMQGSTQYDVIDSYRAEIDADDWRNAPLLVSYQIMNWAIKKINKNNNAKRGIALSKDEYLPQLLKENGLKQSRINKHTLEEQVRHAKILDETLHTFPRLEDTSMTVYRGESSFYYEKASRMMKGDEMTILPFLSTSINRYVAGHFGNNTCMWEITVPPGQIYPYVSEFMPETLSSQTNEWASEQEVLFPTHARLRLVSKSVDQVPNIYRFQLVGFAEKAPDFWDRTLANLIGVLSVALAREKRSGGVRKTNKASKTRKRTKNNRKSHRRTRK